MTSLFRQNDTTRAMLNETALFEKVGRQVLNAVRNQRDGNAFDNDAGKSAPRTPGVS